MILLHGVSLDLTYWDAQFARLSATRDVMAFDWPGHGRSSPLAGETSFDRMAETVHSVVKEAGAVARRTSWVCRWAPWWRRPSR